MLKDKSIGDLNHTQIQLSRNTELTKHI